MADFWAGWEAQCQDGGGPTKYCGVAEDGGQAIYLGPPIAVGGKEIEFYGGPTRDPGTGGISAVPPTPVPISAVINPDGTLTVGENVTTETTTIFGLSPLVVLGIAAVGAYFIFGSK